MTSKAKESASAKQLHNRLAVLRAERGTTRRQLAEAVGVNVQTIGFLERGDYGPSVELALRLAGHFGLPVEALFSLTPFPPMSAQLYPTPTALTSATAPAEAPTTTPAQAGAST
ncbi:DNA-binding XRE family transcriptional regulator [Kineococcus radiotolerans]|uniref:DNA-binding XRE family transcriptional regulator n=1 Tax=Kineococcus radiotolerans TaxID=131568 RepID=A0A7W4THX1_KINRA|nr:helix-turn-helix transcriptional regulator [Kineococcus radiotolerans]MBB2899230.1 DNA-binding XRE family transcriptional regulator [Kineococcus radiotolerans]